MTAKFVLLAVAALSLVACETTEHNDVASKPSRLVVRGAVVPDEPLPKVKPRTTALAAAKPHAAATRPAATRAPVPDATEPATAPAPTETAPAVTPSETAPAVTPSEAATGDTGTAVELSAPSSTLPETPAVETATPTSPVGQPETAGWRLSDIPVMIEALVGGVPLWLMGLIGVVLLAAIGLGMSGGRKAEEPELRYEPETA